MITIPKTMSAVLTKGHGGFEMLEFQNDINVPQPNSNQVLYVMNFQQFHSVGS